MRKKLLFNLVLFWPFFSFATEKEGGTMPYTQSETKRKSFAVTAATSIDIVNKYGDITVNTWNKDSVRFEVTITAEAQKMSQAKSLFEMADVKFTANSGFVMADLDWGTQVNALKRSTVEMSLATGFTQMLRIDYVVYLPAGNTLKIENRFGNVILPSLNGKLYLSLHHGNLKAEKISNAKNVEIKYGDADISEIKDGEINISFGDLLIDKCGDVFIKTSSGTLEIEQAEKVNIEASNEKIRIEKANEVNADVMLSDIRIRELSQKLQVISKIGDVSVTDIKADFSSVDLDCTSGSVSLEFNRNAAFLFDISMEKPKMLTYAKQFVIEDDDKMEAYRAVSGKLGSATVEKVKITTKSCSVSLEIDED